MAFRKKLIIFELNEVPERVLRAYAVRHPKSAIALLLARSSVRKTMAVDTGELSPWITWPTVHRGTSAHGIRNLGEDVTRIDRIFPPFWSLLADAGLEVGLFGCLHSNYTTELSRFSFFLPDAFANSPNAHPPYLEAFQRFNLSMSRRSSRNVGMDVEMGSAVAMLLRARPSLRSLLMAVRQLVRERLYPPTVVRRRSVQAMMSFDLFARELRKARPDCAIFHTNHVAANMHRYWPTWFPEDYTRRWWSPEWGATFRDEIDQALDVTDRMLRNLLNFVRDCSEYSLWLMSSMGQTANDQDMSISTQVLLINPDALMSALGIKEWQHRPAMAPRYTFALHRSEDRAALAGLSVCGEPVAYMEQGSSVTIELGQIDVPDRHFVIAINGHAVAPETVGISRIVVQDRVGSAAGHSPEGILLALDARRREFGEQPIPTNRIAAMILRNFSVPLPTHMAR